MMLMQFSYPLKRITRKYILHAFTTCQEYLKDRGFNPKIHWLDNEASNELKQYNCN